MKLVKTTYAILGAGGFIGSNLSRHLFNEGNIVKAYGKSQNLDQEYVQWHQGRLEDKDVLLQTLTGVDTVIHLATSSVPYAAAESIIKQHEADVVDTSKVINCCIELGIRRIIFLSSGGAVYAPSSHPHKESSPTTKINSYARTRLQIEELLLEATNRSGIEVAILRLSNVYGPHQRTNGIQGVVGRLLCLALTGKPLSVWGDGSAVRDYIYIDDVVNAIALTIIADIEKFSILNIGTGVGTTLHELINGIAKIVPISQKIEYVSPPREMVPSNILDITLAEETLAWKPQTMLDAGLERTKIWMERRLTLPR